MKPSKTAFKRATSALGTLVSISVESDQDSAELNETIDQAFAELHRLEAVLSFHSGFSDLSRLNAATIGEEVCVDAATFELLQLAQNLWQESEGAFSPFAETLSLNLSPLTFNSLGYSVQKNQTVVVDLSGIAKGYIVDQMTQILEAKLSAETSGCINAGGDLRFFGAHEERYPVTLRLGSSDRPLRRDLRSPRPCIASSSRLAHTFTPESSTRYYGGELFIQGETAVSLAGSCCLADAFTKIGMFGQGAAIDRCCEKYQVDLLFFDIDGSLLQNFRRVSA